MNLYFERAEQEVHTEDITEEQQDIVSSIRDTVSRGKSDMDCHDIRLYSNRDKVTTFLHFGVRGDFTVDKLESISRIIKNELKTM